MMLRYRCLLEGVGADRRRRHLAADHHDRHGVGHAVAHRRDGVGRPGTEVTSATPTRPLARAYPAAMKPAPCSFAGTMSGIGGAVFAVVAGRRRRRSAGSRRRCSRRSSRRPRRRAPERSSRRRSCRHRPGGARRRGSRAVREKWPGSFTGKDYQFSRRCPGAALARGRRSPVSEDHAPPHRHTLAERGRGADPRHRPDFHPRLQHRVVVGGAHRRPDGLAASPW